MNRERRKKIDEVIEKANELQDMLQELQEVIEEIRDEEEEYLDNIPENLQGSERYEVAESSVENLDNAVEWFGNDIRKPNELVFGRSGPGGKKNKIVPFKEFKFKYIPSSWTSIGRYINEEGKETVVFWYDL